MYERSILVDKQINRERRVLKRDSTQIIGAPMNNSYLGYQLQLYFHCFSDKPFVAYRHFVGGQRKSPEHICSVKDAAGFPNLTVQFKSPSTCARSIHLAICVALTIFVAVCF